MTAHLEEAQVAQWRDLLTRQQSDDVWLAMRLAGEEASREQTRLGVLDLLARYLQGNVDTEQFRAIFDKKTRKEWDNFGLKGMNGGMFLNQLVKYVPDQEAISTRLQVALPVPADVSAAHSSMQDFVDFIRELHQCGSVSPLQLQVARVPPFLSAFWHLQQVEMWPVFYVSGRQALGAEGLFTPTYDPVKDYFAFRAAFQMLASTLQLSSWELERLLVWHQSARAQSAGQAAATPMTAAASERPEASKSAGSEPAPSTTQQASAHTQVQLLLAKVGRKLGCSVWIAANDQGRQVEAGTLGDWSIKALPTLGLDTATQRVISLIDVLWLKGMHNVVAAFEIEHTTSIYSGLLRLSDLVAMSPNLNFPLYIVSPEDRLADVRRELSRPTFQALELHKRCGYFSEEALQRQAEHIMRWATSPAAIEQLATYIGDVADEGAVRL
jgi:hypothetical protein